MKNRKWEAHLENNGYTLNDVNKLMNEKIEYLKMKKNITEKDPLTPDKYKREAGRFVTLIQSNYPIKMFVLQEIDAEEVRIGYYIVSLKKLVKKGMLSLQWGQFNPNIPKDDLKKLLQLAQERGIL